MSGRAFQNGVGFDVSELDGPHEVNATLPDGQKAAVVTVGVVGRLPLVGITLVELRTRLNVPAAPFRVTWGGWVQENATAGATSELHRCVVSEDGVQQVGVGTVPVAKIELTVAITRPARF